MRLRFRERDAQTPVVLMGYLNSILAMGCERFAAAAAASGVDGLIMVNLPPEAANDLRAELAARKIDLIFLAAPTTTDERLGYILGKASGFVYYVSLKGITGASLVGTEAVAARLEAIRARTDLPVCVGFGIKDADTARALGAHAEGVVVGSALVNLMAAHADDVDAACEALRRAAAELRMGLDA